MNCRACSAFLGESVWILFTLTNWSLTSSMHSSRSWKSLSLLVWSMFERISITVFVDLVLVMDRTWLSLAGSLLSARTHRSWSRRTLYFVSRKNTVLVRVSCRTYQFLVNPFGAFSQKLEVRIGMDVQNIDQLSLQQSANVHPLFVDLLNSKWQKVVNQKSSPIQKDYMIPQWITAYKNEKKPDANRFIKTRNLPRYVILLTRILFGFAILCLHFL